MQKILIVEDDLGISNSLKLYLENSDFEVEVYNTGKWAVEKIVEWNYSMVILDINLPVINGIEICKKVRRKLAIPIVMLTARTSEMDKIKWLEIWADDYVEKPFSPRELLARINGILRRSSYIAGWIKENIIKIDNIEIFQEKRIVKVENKEIDFTKNEFDLLLRIIEEDWKVITREVLMLEVMWYDNYVHDRTLDTHVKNIRKKIDNKDLILTVRWEGYRLNK